MWCGKKMVMINRLVVGPLLELDPGDTLTFAGGSMTDIFFWSLGDNRIPMSVALLVG